MLNFPLVCLSMLLAKPAGPFVMFVTVRHSQIYPQWKTANLHLFENQCTVEGKKVNKTFVRLLEFQT